MNGIYLRRRRKVFVKEEIETAAALPDSYLATLQKNVEQLGFACSPALLNRIRTMSVERLESFYKMFVKELRELVGAHRFFEPLYPNFPQQVMEMSEVELYLNAIYHYATNKRLDYEKEPRAPHHEEFGLRLIDLGTREDFEAIFTRLASAKCSLSKEDKADVNWFVSQYRDDIRRLLPQEIPIKENLAVVGAALLRFSSYGESYIAPKMTSPTDVLRLAVALSDGDVSLAEPTAFKNFSRRERKTLLGWLERQGDPKEDMLRWKERWKRLGERLHPGDYATEFPRTFSAFRVLRENEKFQTFNGKVERALFRRDLPAAMDVLLRRPGDLTRRLDHLLRLGGGERVLEGFAQVAHQAATPMILQVLSHFRQRAHPPVVRTFFPKGDVAKAQVVANKLPPLEAEVAGQVVAICRGSLLQRFAKRARLGKCYVDPRLAKYFVPFSQRSASKSLRTLVRGSRMPMPTTDVMRFFLWWKNGSSRTDIDLSAVMFDEKYRYLIALSYYSLKTYGGCHSGDIVDAPRGASEFIDIDVERIEAHRARYIVVTINSFTRQPYCDLPECFAGWMGRSHANSGEIYEPRSVQDKVDIAANTQICVPMILDLANREVIWTDLALKARPSWNSAAENMSGISMMLYGLTHLAKADLFTLFSLHAEARGEMVDDPAQADHVFSVHHGITPFDFDRIVADFL